MPAGRYESWRRVRARVGVGSTLKVDRNTYSVPSRLIGEVVEVRIGVEELEVRFGEVLMERLPRLRGRGQERINYRHVIEWLVRKAGAFEHYRYREDLLPSAPRAMSTPPGNGRDGHMGYFHLAHIPLDAIVTPRGWSETSLLARRNCATTRATW